MDLDLVVEEDGTRDQEEEEGDQVTGDQELHHDL